MADQFIRARFAPRKIAVGGDTDVTRADAPVVLRHRLGEDRMTIEADADLGALSDLLLILPIGPVLRFARQIMNATTIHVGEKLIYIPDGETVTVLELLDTTTIGVVGPGGMRRVDIGDVTRPRTMAADQ